MFFSMSNLFSDHIVIFSMPKVSTDFVLIIIMLFMNKEVVREK